MAQIIVADDNGPARRALACLLRLEGHQVRCAADGGEALRLMHERPPCLLVLDLMMPVKDGFDVLGEIATDPGLIGLPVIVFSALGSWGWGWHAGSLPHHYGGPFFLFWPLLLVLGALWWFRRR